MYSIFWHNETWRARDIRHYYRVAKESLECDLIWVRSLIGFVVRVEVISASKYEASQQGGELRSKQELIIRIKDQNSNCPELADSSKTISQTDTTYRSWKRLLELIEFKRRSKCRPELKSELISNFKTWYFYNCSKITRNLTSHRFHSTRQIIVTNIKWWKNGAPVKFNFFTPRIKWSN